MKKVFLLFFSLFLFSLLQSQINFISEDITFEIKESEFYINGNYFFKSNKDSCISNIIMYPFPVVDYMGDAFDFEMFTDSMDVDSVVDKNKRRALFKIKHCGKDLFYINMKYKQTIFKDSVVYILTSTKSWKKALHSADYKLIVPNNIEVIGFSYEPDSNLKIEDTIVYFWHKTNFYPNNDFIIRIKKTNK